MTDRMIECWDYQNRRRAVRQVGFVSSDGVVCSCKADQLGSLAPSKLADRSIDAFEQSDRLPHKLPRLAVLRNGLTRILSMLQRVFIAARSARSRCATMHPTPFLPAYGRRHAGRAGAGFGAAAWARQHRAGISRITITRQSFLPCIDPEPTSPSALVGAGDSWQ